MNCQSLLSGYLILMLSLIGCSEQNSSITTPTPASNSRTSQRIQPSASSSLTSISKTETAKSVISSVNANPTRTNPNATVISQNKIISATGIGAAKLGMTYGQLKKELGASAEFQIKSPFMVDWDAIAVISSGKVQYYILYPAGTTFKNSQLIESIFTDNPDYQTAQKVGVDTPIKQAEAIYGDATLFYNTAVESREYIKFANQPAENIFFRPNTNNNQQFVGIYSSASGEYHETQQYQPNSLIGAIGVDCRGNCTP
ncbi:MAG TPA: hypothetical protein V6D15_07220 [Oculatellaceae cyanobacterium]|jgi:hypothetical protein